MVNFSTHYISNQTIMYNKNNYSVKLEITSKVNLYIGTV